MAKTPQPPNPSEGSLDVERFVPYSPGSDVGDWAGWLEVAGATTGFITLSGEIWRPSQPDADGAWQSASSDLVSVRTVAWNSARAALKRAFATPHDDSGPTNYYPDSNAAAVLGLALKAMRWQRPKKPKSDLVGHLCYILENAAKDAAAGDLLSAKELRFKWTAATELDDFPTWLIDRMKEERGTIGSVYYRGGGLVVETIDGDKLVDTGDVIVRFPCGDLEVLKAKALDRGEGCLKGIDVKHGEMGRHGTAPEERGE